MPSDTLFNRVMDAGLADWLSGLETEREQAVAASLQRKALAALGSGGLALLAYLQSKDPILSAFIAFGLFGAAWGWVDGPVRALKRQIKQEANSALAAALGASFTPDAPPSADFRTAEAFGLVARDPDRADYTDLWEGAFGGLDITMHEAHLQEWQGSGRNRRLVTVFRGVVMGYRFARAFHGITVLQRDQGALSWLDDGRETLGGVAMERVRMVDPRFESVFEVFGTDQVEARYLVHPAFCERLIETEAAFHGTNLRLVFAEGRVVVVLDTQDWFESGGLDAAGDEARLRETIGQLGALLDLARTLNERAR